MGRSRRSRHSICQRSHLSQCVSWQHTMRGKASVDITPELAHYLTEHYSGLFTPTERLVSRHLSTA